MFTSVTLAPTGPLKGTGFERYGLALGKIALRIFRRGTLKGRSHFQLRGGSHWTAQGCDGCFALLRAGRVAVVVLGSQLWGGLILKRHYLAPEKAMLVRIDKEFSWLRMLDSPVGSQDVRVLLKGTGSPPLNSLPGNPIKPVPFKGPVSANMQKYAGPIHMINLGGNFFA